MLRLRSSILIQDNTSPELALGTIRGAGHVLTEADILAYECNELNSESRKMVDCAIASNASIRTMAVNCGYEDDVPPILVRHRGFKV